MDKDYLSSILERIRKEFEDRIRRSLPEHYQNKVLMDFENAVIKGIIKYGKEVTMVGEKVVIEIGESRSDTR